jgi:nitrogen fixation protein NifU and related proteins
MDDMYREVILEHSKYPHNAGTLEQPDISHEEHNPLCGDRVRIDLQVANGVITDVRFKGRGCAISQASASLLTDELKGKTLDQARAISKDDMLDLIGIPLDKNPVRIKCALLPLKSLKVGVYEYLGAHMDDEEL